MDEVLGVLLIVYLELRLTDVIHQAAQPAALLVERHGVAALGGGDSSVQAGGACADNGDAARGVGFFKARVRGVIMAEVGVHGTVQGAVFIASAQALIAAQALAHVLYATFDQLFGIVRVSESLPSESCKVGIAVCNHLLGLLGAQCADGYDRDTHRLLYRGSLLGVEVSRTVGRRNPSGGAYAAG